MAQINESPQNVFIYDKTNDTWHQMGGKVATNANYIWTGAHQFNSNVLMNGNVQVTTKFNSYNTELERDEAMPNPSEGLISYIKYDNLGNEVNSNFGETSPSITPDGKYLFFSRYNDEGGLPNFYWVSTEIIHKLKAAYFKKEQ